MNRSVTAYCFGDANEDERHRFEAHMLECDFCRAEVERLFEAVHALRGDRDLGRSVLASDIVGMLGLSARFDRLLGGHIWHGMLAASLYGLLYGVAVLVELAYQFDAYEVFARGAAGVATLWIIVTTLGALLLDWSLVARRRNDALAWGAVALGASAACLYLGLRPLLPAHHVTEANFQTYTAQAAYLKSVFYFLPLAIIYVLVPFHFVVSMQRELAAGRHLFALELLTGGSGSVPPQGSVYVRFWVLVALLVAGTIASFVAAMHLLENLRPGVYMNLFIQLVQVRWCLYLLLALESVGWYYLALSEVRRECLAVKRIAQAPMRRD